MNRNLPIGFFDSGVGGISVLKEAIKILPNEKFIYFGDSKNAPYGTKSKEEIKDLSIKAAEFLRSHKVKAIVVACNTATSAAIEELRVIHMDIPIIGIEPALKPAIERNTGGKIMVMATPRTLQLDKFIHMKESYENNVEIVSKPCPGLVEFIEKGIVEGAKLNNLLKDIFGEDINENITTIVLGCTHYPFVKKEIQKIYPNALLIDGSCGTVKQLKRKLEAFDGLSDEGIGTVKIYNSLDKEEILEISNMLLNLN